MQNDATLAEAARMGDRDAFETLYRTHVRAIYLFVYARTHHRETAEDLVSQTWLKALDRIGTYKPGKGSFVGWVHGIARNLIIDHYRQFHPTGDIQDAWDLQSDADVSSEADQALRLTEIRSLLKGLTPAQRDTILLRVWHGRTFAEIAEILGTTEAAAKMTYKRTIDKMRSLLPLLLLSLSSFSSTSLS